VRFIVDMKVEGILDLEPKPYIYDKDAWLSFKEKINTHQ